IPVRIDAAGRAQPAAMVAPSRDRIADHDLARTEMAGPQRDCHADGAPAEDQHVVTTAELRTIDGVQADRQRFDEGTVAVPERLGEPKRLSAPDFDVFRVGATAAADTDGVGAAHAVHDIAV